MKRVQCLMTSLELETARSRRMMLVQMPTQAYVAKKGSDEIWQNP